MVKVESKHFEITAQPDLRKPNLLDSIIALLLGTLSSKHLEELGEPRQNLTAIASKSNRQI